MNRVELVEELDTSTATDLKERIDNGEHLSFSMGSRVKYDECSICGNKAKNLQQYCDHLKHQMNRVLPDGRKVYAINRYPKFFDISFVTIPADKTAFMFSKVASVQEDLSEVEIEELMKKAEREAIKRAEIKKNIPIQSVEATSSDPLGLIYRSQPKMSDGLIDELLHFKLDKILSTLLALKIMPTKRDFQTLVLKAGGRHELADQLNARNIVFPVSKILFGIIFVFPINIVTAIVSPNALPKASI
jgi:hypothetical protein